jgi:hypothetical protein
LPHHFGKRFWTVFAGEHQVGHALILYGGFAGYWRLRASFCMVAVGAGDYVSGLVTLRRLQGYWALPFVRWRRLKNLRCKNLQKHARMQVTQGQRMHRAPSCDFSSQTRSTTACRLGGRAFCALRCYGLARGFAPLRRESTIKDVAACAINHWASGLFHSQTVPPDHPSKPSKRGLFHNAKHM